MFNKNRKTKKSLLISTYECLILHYNFIENNNNLYLYGKKDKTKKIYQVTPNNIRTALVLLNKDYLATDSNTKNFVCYIKSISDKICIKKSIFTRIGFDENTIYIDTLNENKFIKIDSVSVSIEEESPLLFFRNDNMRPLPIPDIDLSPEKAKQYILHMKKFVNFDNKSLKLSLVWLMSYFLKEGTYPILMVDGPQGSAKTSSLTFLARIIDPREHTLIGIPRTSRDLYVYAQKNTILAFDNVSEVSPSMCDELCKLASSGSITTRKLYSDDESMIIKAKCLIAFNGIGLNINRNDILDRAILVETQPIHSISRISENDLNLLFNKFYKNIFSAIVYAVHFGLKNCKKPSDTSSIGRLVDVEFWAYRWAPAFKINSNELIQIVSENQNLLQSSVSENSSFCNALCHFMVGKDKWKGTITNLLEELEEEFPSEARRKDWPKTPQLAGSQVKRLKSSLEQYDISYRSVRKNSCRLVILEKKHKD